MYWKLSHHASKQACKLADRHYSRKTVGSNQMMPPGRKLVFTTPDGLAVWGSHWPFFDLVMHSFGDSWICSIFRNEGKELSSLMIQDAVSATHFVWGSPPEGGFITFINKAKVRGKKHFGYCFRKAGFEEAGYTKSGLLTLRLPPQKIISAKMPIGYQMQFFPHNKQLHPTVKGRGG